jgi:hypothetical protein
VAAVIVRNYLLDNVTTIQISQAYGNTGLHMVHIHRQKGVQQLASMSIEMHSLHSFHSHVRSRPRHTRSSCPASAPTCLKLRSSAYRLLFRLLCPGTSWSMSGWS